MTKLPRALFVLAGCLLLPVIPTAAFAQLCFDIFEDLTDPSLSCADTFYFVDGPVSGTDDQSLFTDGDTGLLGADFDGFDLFDPTDPELAPPDNLLEPFFSDIQYNQTNIGGQINTFQARHRGSVSMRSRDSESQNASYGTVSRITFIPFTTDGSTDPVILDLDFDFDFTLEDPVENQGGGGAFAGAAAKIFDPDDPLEPLFDFNGFAALDLEFDDEPAFGFDFDGPASSFEPSGPGITDEFDIDVEFDTTFTATPGRPLTLDTDTFGAIFTDGFESGDTSAWKASSIDTYVFTISSSNPNVRFMFVVEAAGPDVNYGHAGGWFNPLTVGQGFLFDFLLDTQFMFVAAFTFDTAQGQKGGAIDGAEQRWFTAQGNYAGNTANLTIFQTRNGVFDDPTPPVTQPVGTMEVEFQSCTQATITYDLPSFGLSGVIPVVKLLADEICTQIVNGEIELKSAGAGPPAPSGGAQPINYGLIGGWFDPATAGQGFLIDFLLDTQFMFVAWFTFDTAQGQKGGSIPGSELRWLTAQGNYTTNRADLTLFATRNGVFDDPTPTMTDPVGTMRIEFDSCITATLTYDLPGFGLSGSISAVKLLADEICTAINDGLIDVK